MQLSFSSPPFFLFYFLSFLLLLPSLFSLPLPSSPLPFPSLPSLPLPFPSLSEQFYPKAYPELWQTKLGI